MPRPRSSRTKQKSHLDKIRRRQGGPIRNKGDYNTSASSHATPNENMEGDEVMDVDEELLLDHQPDDTPFEPKGRRIVDILYLFQQIFLICSHASLFGCNFQHMVFQSEKRTGLYSIFFLKCGLCQKQFTMETSRRSNKRADINQELVSGIISIGSGFTHLKTILACLGVPSLTLKLYRSVHNQIRSWWKRAAEFSMSEAAKKEAEHAKSTGSIHTDGTPMITVTADACWSKRSYGNCYRALSGAAAIIGYYTKKVLFYGIRNKFCLTCARASNRRASIPRHSCSKNYSGPSTGMESSIILEGFKKSLSSLGLIYSRIIADGDSSTYSEIRDKRPYRNLTVAKLFCKNHLLRNYCKAFLAICSDTKLSIRARKLLKERYLRLRWAVDHIVKHWKSLNLPLETKIKNITKDILNSPYHIFGDHKNCDSYFCTPETRKPDEENLVTELSVSGVFHKINTCVFNLAQYSNSLVHNVTSNLVECFNSKIAKYIGGKRVNYSSGNSYEARCAAAVVSFNMDFLHSATHQVIFGVPANDEIVELEKKMHKKQQSKTKRFQKSVLEDAQYGQKCQKPDMEDVVYNSMRDEFMKRLELTSDQRQQLERDTVSQSDNPLWLDYRRNLLTASWFGKVCKRRANTDCKNFVKAILYGKSLDHVPAIKYGKNNEQTALFQLSVSQGIQIGRCGLFIDENLPYLGATPDGVFEDGIIEVKCPISAKGLSPDDAISKKKITFWKLNAAGHHEINKAHHWYYQIQGQLHISKANLCLFCVWTGDNDMKIDKIPRDNDFWNKNMEEKLKNFYLSCLLPELIDPRHARSMELRSHSSH